MIVSTLSNVRTAVQARRTCPLKKLGLYLESLDISKQTSDIPMTFERTFRWKFLTTGHLVYLGPCPAGGQSITTLKKRISGDLFYGRGRLPKTKKAAHRRKYFPT